jgi:hypothetical protein
MVTDFKLRMLADNRPILLVVLFCERAPLRGVGWRSEFEFAVLPPWRLDLGRVGLYGLSGGLTRLLKCAFLSCLKASDPREGATLESERPDGQVCPSPPPSKAVGSEAGVYAMNNQGNAAGPTAAGELLS